MAGTSNIADLTTTLDDIALSQAEQLAQTKTRGSSELGKEEFLQLLVCQLQNQDPLNPQNDTEFVSQLAQFSSLEQMTNMNTTMSNSSAYNLVGKEVIVQTTDATGQVQETRGIVDYVEMQNGKAMLSIDGKMFSLDDLVQVMDSAYAAKDYLPSVEELTQVYDLSNPSLTKVKIDLGSNGYEANSVSVILNGEYIDTNYLKYDAEDGVLTISPEAFKDLAPGSYYLGFFFDDPYATSITDKVTIKVVNSGIDLGGADNAEESENTDDAEKPEEGEDNTENA